MPKKKIYNILLVTSNQKERLDLSSRLRTLDFKVEAPTGGFHTLNLIESPTANYHALLVIDDMHDMSLQEIVLNARTIKESSKELPIIVGTKSELSADEVNFLKEAGADSIYQMTSNFNLTLNEITKYCPTS